jgi:hypothetical protein
MGIALPGREQANGKEALLKEYLREHFPVQLYIS